MSLRYRVYRIRRPDGDGSVGKHFRKRSFRIMVSLGSLREQHVRAMLSDLIPAAVREFRPSILFCACASTILGSLLLGGGTRDGFLSDAVLELLAIPALLISIACLVEVPWAQSKRRAEWALSFCLAISILPLVQLVPLPPWIWTRMPGRDNIATVFDLLGDQRPWMPISVSPSA